MLELVFPDLCPYCESPFRGRGFCSKCLKSIRFIKGSVCLKCGVPFNSHSQTASHHLCGLCLSGNEFCFHRARSVAVYDGMLKEMLHKFKYNGRLSLGEPISQVFVEGFPSDFEPVDLVVPVPLHLNKLRKREYNQSLILGLKVAKFLGVCIDPFVIKREVDTKPQFEITNRSERLRNVRNAFRVVNTKKVKNKSVLVLDDVFTTGSTSNECSRVLLDAGASCVQVVTLMRSLSD
ncbi:MAG: amidophosphoribosyltransferase [Deltaproteobacteria bacterium]|nr:MAG: amidophosphoribosyltransferase [Deltaproteobacteria bacterium]